MIRDPHLKLRLLSDADKQPSITATQWIVHTAVDGPGPTNLHGYFENHTNLESHTWLRFGGSHEQFVSFDRSADANYQANRFWADGKWCGAVSTETEDDGKPAENPWDSAQLAELVRFGVWLNQNLGIPAVIPSSPTAPGMGWHVLHPNHWTNVRGKTCPGPLRINQFKTIVLPRIQAAINSAVPTIPLGDDEMFEVDLEKHIRAVYKHSSKLGTTDENGILGWIGNIGSQPDAAKAREALQYLHHVGGMAF